MVMRVGMVGASPGNGHPFSFSAIVNGFDDRRFEAAGWPVIHDYLRRRPPESFGFDGVRVTHAWTQDADVTRRLCSACGIDNACADPAELIDAVDAIVVARDDWRSHAELALPALERGKSVFVDKPLTLDAGELRAFQPFLASGRLMSTSGLRYAGELDPLRDDRDRLGSIRLIQGVVLNGLETYGIHLLEAVAGLDLGLPVGVTRLNAPHEAFAFELEGGALFTLHCLGDVGRTFSLHFFGDREHARFDLHDNFTAFRRTLDAFFGMCRTGNAPIHPLQTQRIVETLIVARRLAPGERSALEPHV